MTARAGWKSRPAPGVARVSEVANGVRLRLAWEELAAKVRSACTLTDALGDSDTLLTLGRLVAQTGRAAPPFESAPVRAAAAGFRQMAEAFVQSHPARRADMVETLVAGARLLDGFVTEERTRQAQSWRHHSGGD